MTNKAALYKYLLRLGDNALINGHRLSEWCSKGPILEEDLALTNIALDNIGCARAFLQYAGEVDGTGKSEDYLAYKRGERDFYNNLIYELPIGNFAYTIAKQLIIASFENLNFSKLSHSTDETIANIAIKTSKEVRYHLAHARDWCYRLGKGTATSHQKLQEAFDELWAYTDDLFEMTEDDLLLAQKGIITDLSEIKPEWMKSVAEILIDSNIAVPETEYMQTGSRKAIHTEYLGHILAEMQYLPRAYPDATW